MSSSCRPSARGPTLCRAVAGPARGTTMVALGDHGGTIDPMAGFDSVIRWGGSRWPAAEASDGTNGLTVG